MSKVSIDLDAQSPYVESLGGLALLRRKLTYRFAFKLIRKFAPDTKGLSILEIGTGSGYFLRFCEASLPDARLCGVEYDPRLYALTRLHAPKSECFLGNAESFDLGAQRFDVIVSFQVIEHLFNPQSMLLRVREHLKPGGLFIVTSPNLGGLGARLLRAKWHGYRSDHVNLRSSQEWDELISSLGFRSIYCGSTFFSGMPLLNAFPLGVVNWAMLLLFGSLRWKHGESYVGAFYRQ